MDFTVGALCVVVHDRTVSDVWQHAPTIGCVVVVARVDTKDNTCYAYVPALKENNWYKMTTLAPLSKENVPDAALKALVDANAPPSAAVLAFYRHKQPPMPYRFVRLRADLSSSERAMSPGYVPGMNKYKDEIAVVIAEEGENRWRLRFKDGLPSFQYHPSWTTPVDRVSPALRRELVVPRLLATSALGAAGTFVRMRTSQAFGIVVGGCAASKKSFAIVDAGAIVVRDDDVLVTSGTEVPDITKTSLCSAFKTFFGGEDDDDDDVVSDDETLRNALKRLIEVMDAREVKRRRAE